MATEWTVTGLCHTVLPDLDQGIALRSGCGRVSALADVSFDLRQGLFATFMGVSGSGKSTLLNCVAGIERPDRGEVHCFGAPVHRLAAMSLCRFQRRDLGIVFQRGNLLSYLAVAENIGLPLTLNGIAGAARNRRISDLLEAIGLRDAASALLQGWYTHQGEGFRSARRKTRTRRR